MPQIALSLTPRDSAEPPVSVQIWGSDTCGLDEGDDVAQWLSQFLNTPSRMLVVHPAADRIASLPHVNAWRRQHAQLEPDFPAHHPFGFADGFPFLIASQGSLDELNRQLQAKGEAAVPMNRFRPNIVLEGLDAYEEDHLARLRAGNLAFALVKRCARCPIPNIDQSTALSGPEPGLTLAAHRRFIEGVLFGVNAVVAGAGAGARLRIGDRVDIDLNF